MDNLHLVYTQSQKDLLNFMNTPPQPPKKSLNSDDYKAENVAIEWFLWRLGSHFTPGPFDVICARGKQAYQHPGNRYFRSLVQAATEKYSLAASKLERTMIVSEIVDAVRRKGNGFVRQNDSGEWVECDEILAREKTGQLFRNSLGTKYKSSVKSKRKRRALNQPSIVETVQDILFSTMTNSTCLLHNKGHWIAFVIQSQFSIGSRCALWIEEYASFQ